MMKDSEHPNDPWEYRKPTREKQTAASLLRKATDAPTAQDGYAKRKQKASRLTTETVESA